MEKYYNENETDMYSHQTTGLMPVFRELLVLDDIGLPPSPLSCTNCDRQTRGLRVDGKYIDYCLEEIEEEGYCGFLRKRAQTRLRHLQHPRLLHNGISIDGHKRCLPSEIQPESPEPTVVWDQWARFYRF